MSLILSGTDGLSDVDGSAANPAIRGTDANTGIFFPAADTIAFAEGGAEVARFDSSGNFGLGVTPTQKLQVAGKIAVSGTNPSIQQIVQNSYLDLCGGTTVGTDPSIQIAGSTTVSDANTVFYNSNAHLFRTSSGGTTISRLNQYGIGLSTATPSSGVGITFPATQSASSNANTLDDYEEGTWTPTITSYSGSVTAYTSQGSYVKIGRIVFATVYAVVSNAGTASGAYIISSLPFSLATPLEVYGYGVNLLTNVGLIAFGYSATHLFCFTAAGAFPGGSGTYVTLNFNYSV